MYTFEDYVNIISTLRSPQGCPWDKAQTHDTLINGMIDEMAEAIAGIDVYHQTGDAANFCEELGDLLLQIVLQSQIAQEECLFSIQDVVQGAAEKMIRRHPHVFGSQKELPDWEAIKKEEKKRVPPEVEKAKEVALERAKQRMQLRLLR